MKTGINITISRNSQDEINLTLIDSASGIQFVDAMLSLADFASVITGIGMVPITADLRGLEYVGKNKVMESRTIECQLKTSDKEALKSWLATNCKEDGWLIDNYLGRQSSVFVKDNRRYLNYSVYKYVDAE